MDGHGVLALVAPRACALADGWTDREGDLTFADEAAVRAAQGVYVLLGAPANLTLMCAPHCHPLTRACAPRIDTPPARAAVCALPHHAPRAPHAPLPHHARPRQSEGPH